MPSLLLQVKTQVCPPAPPEQNLHLTTKQQLSSALFEKEARQRYAAQ